MIKEYKLEDINPVADIIEKVWKSFEVLRSYIRSTDYYIVLFILSLQKDGILNCLTKEKNPIRLKHEILKCIESSEIDNKEGYQTIYEIFEPLLKNIPENTIIHLFTLYGELNQEKLKEHFSEIFDDLLYKISNSQGREAGDFIQPIELTRFICSLANLPEKSKVFNPFAGLASFGVFLDQGQDYFGQEINQKIWALGVLRIMAYGRPGTSHYVCDDSILHWPNEKFDLILANPPYGLRLNQYYREVELGLVTIEHFLIEKGIRSLSEKGKLIALLPQGFLFRGMSEERLREHLIEEDLIDTIISLPGGLLLNTGIRLIVLVIDKDKKTPGKVRFIDAKTFVYSKGPREKVLNDYSLNSVIHGKNKNSDVVRIIDNSQIKEFNYNLNVPRYFQKHIEGIKLKEIVEVVKGRRSFLSQEGKMIRIRDLKDDKVDFKLDLSYVEQTELHRPNLRIIEESCLLLATRWKTLKPSYFEFTGDPIFLNPDILSFKINKQLVDITYLINELQADYVKEQLESYRVGAAIPFIKRDDLLEIIIKVPSLIDQQHSLELQRAKVQGIVELTEEIKVLQHERNALVHAKATSKFSEFASLKHTLGRPRQNILDWTDNLLHFLDVRREGFDSLNKAFLEFYEIDILSALKEIKRDVNFITDVLEKGENGFVVEEFDKTIISLWDVNNLISELSSNSFNFKIKKLLLKGEKLKDRGIYGNKTLLKTLIDNILTNAHKYGFKKKIAGNEVVFDLTEVDDFLSMEVRNNGNPFPKNYDREMFITKFSTADSNSSSGLGGYDIHRIASEFKNSDWELNLNTDPIYPVKFKFQFPIKLIN